MIVSLRHYLCAPLTVVSARQVSNRASIMVSGHSAITRSELRLRQILRDAERGSDLRGRAGKGVVRYAW
jgi:hypothetical protein